MCNAKMLLASLNRWLTGSGYRAVGADQIARKMTCGEIPEGWWKSSLLRRRSRTDD